MMKDEDLNQLEEYAELDGTEWGETVQLLLQVYQNRPYISDTFLKAVEKELKSNLKDAKKYCTIVEEPYTHSGTTRRLDWN